MNVALSFAALLLTVSSAIAPATLASDPLTIVVYDQPGFKGRTLTINRAVPDLRALKFNDRIASFAIQGLGDWVLCENPNYAGRCVRVTAKADDLDILQLSGRVSSLYPAPPAAP